MGNVHTYFSKISENLFGKSLQMFHVKKVNKGIMQLFTSGGLLHGFSKKLMGFFLFRMQNINYHVSSPFHCPRLSYSRKSFSFLLFFFFSET